MVIPLRMFLGAVTLLSACGSVAQKESAALSLRPVDIVIAELLKAGSVSGGIEVTKGCDQLPGRSFTLTNQPVEDALTNLAQIDQHMTWQKAGRAYSVKVAYTATTEITSTQLPALQLKIRTLSQASEILLAQKALRTRFREFGMVEAPDNIGFSSINEREERDVSLPAGTLRDDLNAVALAFGHAIWQFDQQQCGSSRTFRLSWISK